MLPCMTTGTLQGPERVRLSWVILVGSTCNHRYPYKVGRLDCRKGGGDMIKEAESRMSHKPRDVRGLQELEEARVRFSDSPLKSPEGMAAPQMPGL